MTRTAPLVAVYLAAIAAANLSVAEWGPRVSVYNAFLFIGLDLSTRDRLHDLWQHHRRRNLAALILTGSLLSWLLGLWLGNGDNVARVAIASCIAFAAGATVDTIVYQRLRAWPWFERVNGSNVPSAAVDSLIFLPAAGYGFPWAIMFAQFCAKAAGGLVWSFLLRRTPGQEWLARNRALYGKASP